MASEVTVMVKKRCEACGGTGRIYVSAHGSADCDLCAECMGTGWIATDIPLDDLVALIVDRLSLQIVRTEGWCDVADRHD